VHPFIVTVLIWLSFYIKVMLLLASYYLIEYSILTQTYINNAAVCILIDS
jgi:hypothetical protein